MKLLIGRANHTDEENGIKSAVKFLENSTKGEGPVAESARRVVGDFKKCSPNPHYWWKNLHTASLILQNRPINPDPSGATEARKIILATAMIMQETNDNAEEEIYTLDDDNMQILESAVDYLFS